MSLDLTQEELNALGDQAAARSKELEGDNPTPPAPTPTEPPAPQKAEEPTPTETPAETPSETPPAEAPATETPQPETPAAEATTGEPAAPEAPKTRKEKREERFQRFIDSVRKDKSGLAPTQPVPKPELLDYTNAEAFSDPETGYIKPDVLSKDREAAIAAARAEGEQVALTIAEQRQFEQSVEFDSQRLWSEPKFSFLDPNSESYDPERATLVNDLFLEAAGYQEIPVVDQNGAPVIDPQTRRQVIRPYYGKTNISYHDFVSGFVNKIEAWVDNSAEESNRNLEAQRANGGVKPTATPKKSNALGPLTEGSIAAMDDESYERNRDKVNQQLADMARSIQ